MYTVVIAERATKNLFGKYRFLLAELLGQEDLVFCEWNRKAESIASMTQSLEELIGKRTEWRALVITTEGQEQVNPFDCVQYADRVQHKKKYSEKYLKWLREERIAAFTKAVSNPLTKLSYALCGPPVSDKNILTAEKLEKLRAERIGYGELMLEQQFSKGDTVLQAKHLLLYHRAELNALAGEEKAENLAALVEHKNARAVAEMLGLKDIAELLRLMNNGFTVYSDPLFIEQIVENTAKCALLEPLDAPFSLKCEKPREVICVGLRTADPDNYEQLHKWKGHDELEYSKFSEYNLYSDALKFLFMDIHAEGHKAHEFDMLRFLSFVLLLAENELPLGVVEKNKVYNVTLTADNDRFMTLLAAYDDKLRRTAAMLKERQQELRMPHGVTVDTNNLISLVETPVEVPVVTSRTYSSDMLELDASALGLARDCPEEEGRLIYTQYKDIRRNFITFLKEPRKALSQASENMRRNSTIDDESALYLDRFQIEDVNDNAAEAEEQIVAAKTENIYKNAQYLERMEQSKKDVTDFVEIRMTRRTAILGGLAALGTFFIGFVPLLLSSSNTLGTWGFSLLVAVSATGALFGVGVFSLFRMRKRLRELCRRFNESVHSMVNEVQASLADFGKYLTSVGSFMRAQSVLNMRREREKKEIVTAKIYQKHIQDIEHLRSDIRDAFGRISYPADDSPDAEIYDYDFTLAIDYTYDIPVIDHGDCYMEYLQEGNRIASPIYYIDSIRLRREELYD